MPLIIYICLYFEDFYESPYLSLSLIASPPTIPYASLKIQPYSFLNSTVQQNLSSHSSWTSVHSSLKFYSIAFNQAD